MKKTIRSYRTQISIAAIYQPDKILHCVQDNKFWPTQKPEHADYK
ncbi:hypothetical protein [Mucilaginibacter sp.]|nr:hypothetical protein [Mucilaginibacter sp.]